MTLAKRVRDCRYAKGWGPDELASKAEISRTALYQIECGKTELPRAATLRRIAKALDVSVDVLLDESLRLPSFSHPSEVRKRRDGRHRGQSDEAAFAETIAVDHRGAGSPALREQELTRKLHEILDTPLGEALARMVEETHRIVASHRQFQSH